MSTERIFLATPHMSEEEYEMEFIREAFETNWIAPLGENVDRFEEELCQRVGVKSGAAVASGTMAIHLALRAAGVHAADRVICQSLTFAASANPIIYENAVPVFIDSHYLTWNIDPNLLEEALKKHRPKAVIVVHLYGLSADMDPIMELCRKYEAVLIEDAAESLGTKYKGRESGTMGDFGIYSFNGNKVITTSGGGMVVSNDQKLIDKIRFWSTQARDPAPHYQHSELGFNYRMSNIVAGIGRGQLKVLENRLQKKKYIYHFYREAFAEIEEIEMMPLNEWDDPNFWLSTILVNGKVTSDDVIHALDAHGIESRHVWKPMHLQPYYEHYDYIGNGVADDLFKRGICLPSDTKLRDTDLNRVVDAVKELYR